MDTIKYALKRPVHVPGTWRVDTISLSRNRGLCGPQRFSTNQNAAFITWRAIGQSEQFSLYDMAPLCGKVLLELQTSVMATCCITFSWFEFAQPDALWQYNLNFCYKIEMDQYPLRVHQLEYYPCNMRPMRTHEVACPSAPRSLNISSTMCRPSTNLHVFARWRPVSCLTRLKPFSRFSALVSSWSGFHGFPY